MASLFKRPDSPFFWIRLNDNRRYATSCRVGTAAEKRRALQELGEAIKREAESGGAKKRHHWARWVPSWFDTKYGHNPSTANSYKTTWKTIQAYLLEKKLHSPEQVRREHALDYLAWRKKVGHMNGRKNGGKAIAHNTAVQEVKLLSIVMSEACRRSMINYNPCFRLGLKKEAARIKSALTDEHIQKLRAEIRKLLDSAKTDDEKEKARFMDTSFEFALAQGVRLFETHRPMSAFDTENMTVELVVKGSKTELRPMSNRLLELVQKWRAEGRTETYRKPAQRGLIWFKFFEALRIKDPSFATVSFHSTRVTVVSRLHEAGVSESVAMSLVGHASVAIHRKYRRVSSRETRDAWASVKMPPNDIPSAPGSPDSSDTTR